MSPHACEPTYFVRNLRVAHIPRLVRCVRPAALLPRNELERSYTAVWKEMQDGTRQKSGLGSQDLGEFRSRSPRPDVRAGSAEVSVSRRIPLRLFPEILRLAQSFSSAQPSDNKSAREPFALVRCQSSHEVPFLRATGSVFHSLRRFVPASLHQLAEEGFLYLSLPLHALPHRLAHCERDCTGHPVIHHADPGGGFVRARQAAAHSYLGYDDEITALRGRTRDAIERVDVLIARQGHLLETVAIAELESRRERLEAYQSQARFAFADSYDRATKAQAQ